MNCLCGKKKVESKNISSCMNCRSNPAIFLRDFDYKKLPVEYFHEPDEYVKSILRRENISAYPDYWIHLPHELKLTRYQYKVCIDCYNLLKDQDLNLWNEWIRI